MTTQHSAETLRRIDAVCDQFEVAWRAGHRPVVDDYLLRCDSNARPQLLEWLQELKQALILASDAETGHVATANQPTPEAQGSTLGPLAGGEKGNQTSVDPLDAGGSSLTPADIANRSLLFGIVAVQMNFISREALVSGMKEWVANKDRLLGAILVERNLIPPEHRRMLEPLVLAYLQQYDNDPKLCLAALSSITSIQADLELLQDSDLTASFHAAAAIKPSNSSQQPRSTNEKNLATRFRILRPHAKGGLGQVSIALDTELNREVALKEIQKKHLHDSAGRSRFVLEAEITGSLQHPGIVPVYGLGQFSDGSPFYAMRFVSGDSLKTAIENYHDLESLSRKSDSDRRLELRQLLGRFIDVCNAVEYAHSRGVLHRDLKPGNVMLGQYGETLVVDWGLAKTTSNSDAHYRRHARDGSTGDPESPHTQTGTIMGTPAYMSPEQASGKLKDLGPAADIYSLGATLYHVLTGRSPFIGKGSDILEKVRQGNFRKPRAVYPDTPLELESICLKAMSLEPQKRYQSAKQFADDLERWLANERVEAHSETWSGRLSRLERKHRSWVRAGFMSSLVVAALSTVAVMIINHERIEKSNLANSATKAESIAKALQVRADENAGDALAKQAELQIQLAKTHFQHGVSEFEIGQAADGAEDLVRAWQLLPQAHHLRAPYEQVILDRLTGRGKGIPHFGGLRVSPDGKRILSANYDKGRIRSYQIINAMTTMQLGVPIKKEGVNVDFAFTCDSKYVYGFGEHASLELWDARTGASLGALSQSESSNTMTSASLDGRFLAASSGSKVLRLWDLHALPRPPSVLRHPSAISCFAFSPDGTRMASASQDNNVRLWDLSTGEAAAELMRHSDKVLSLAFSPRGNLLATGCNDKRARIWNTQSKTLISELPAYESAPGILAFSPDGSGLLTANDHTVRMWNVGTQVLNGTAMLHDRRIHSVDFSPDGTRLATSSTDGEIRLWDARSGSPISLPLKSNYIVHRPTFNSDGTLLYGATRVWEAFPTVPLANSIATYTYVMDVSFTADGKRILAAVGPSVLAWDAVTLAPLGEFVRDDLEISRLSVSPDGQRLATGTMAISPIDRTTYVRIWDVKSGIPTCTPMKHSQTVHDVAFSPDGAMVVTGCIDGIIRLWDTTTGAVIRQSPAGQLSKYVTRSNPCRGLAFSPDGLQLSVGNFNRGEIWDTRTLKPIRILDPQYPASSAAFSTSFSPDGTRLLIGNTRFAQIWDIRTASPIGETMRHDLGAELADVAFSPDGSIAATAVDGKAIFLWDAWTGMPLGEPFYHERVSAVGFSPDGKRLVTGGLDKKLRVWDTSPLPRPKDFAMVLVQLSGVRLSDEMKALTNNPGMEDTTAWNAAMKVRQMTRARQYQMSQAGEAEIHENWFAAEFHLRHLLQVDPKNTELARRLQIARDHLKPPP